MLKTYEVMTHEVISCTPDTTVAEAAAIMRDHDIGNVLVVEDGKLRGIVTDRDLTVQALAGKDDPSDVSVHKFMNSKVVTGKADWTLEQAAKTMAKHQVRRLPIVQDGQLVGILSLGDIARYAERKVPVTKSLQAISTPAGISAPEPPRPAGALIGFALVATAATVMAWLNWSHSGREVSQQITESKFYHTAKRVLGTTVDKVVEAASGSKPSDEGMTSNFNNTPSI